jgi:glycosyltransferase involved in cell wall biosynthesis
MRMRIALVSQEYPPETAHGGIGSQTQAKARGLASLGHEVHVISTGLDGQASESEDGGIHVRRIAGFDPCFKRRLYTESARWVIYSTAVAGAIIELHERAPLDLLDFPELGAEAFVHLLNRTEYNYIPTVIQLHGPLVMLAQTVGWPAVDSEHYRIGTWMEGTCLRLADAIYSSSHCSADWCVRHYGLARERVTILHTGVDTQLFRPGLAPKAERPTIVFVGNLVEKKGVALLVDAALRLAPQFPGLRLRLVGRGEADYIEEELWARVRTAGRPDLLEVVGFVPRDQLPQHLCRAHVFAVPSSYEGGPGLVWLEAMACGLPVIACQGSGVTEVVRHGENGMLIPPGDLESLSLALQRLLRDEAWSAALGARGRQDIVAEADSEICLRRLEAFCQQVAARPRPAIRSRLDGCPT